MTRIDAISTSQLRFHYTLLLLKTTLVKSIMMACTDLSFIKLKSRSQQVPQRCRMFTLALARWAFYLPCSGCVSKEMSLFPGDVQH
jgi:hypothetical protein